MADAVADLFVVLTASTSGFVAGMTEAAATAEAASASILAAFTEIDTASAGLGAGFAAGTAEATAAESEMGASVEALAAKTTAAAAEIDAAMTTIGAGTERAAAVVTAADTEMGAAAEALAVKTDASGAAAAIAEGRLGGLAAKSGATGAEMKALGSTFDGVAGKVGMTGAQFGLLSLAATGVIVKTSEMASTFDQNMTRLATQAHVPQSEINTLGQAVLGLAGKVGEDPNSLADAMFHIQSSFAGAGLSAEKATQILTVAAEGARMGGANLVDVTNAMDAAIVSGIPGVQDYNQAMGMLNATVGAGDMKMQDLAEAMGTGVLAVIKGYGATMRDASAALAVFGDNNIRGAQAGTQLRMTVQALAVPMKAGVANLKALGLSSDQLAKDMQHGGLNEAMTDLHDHLQKAGITGVKVGQWLTDSFGKRAGAGVSVLMGQYDRFEQKLGEVDKGAKSFADDWTKQQDTAAQKTADFKAAVSALGIQMGNVFLPILTTVVGWIGKAVTWFAAHQAAAKALAVVIGGVVAMAFTTLAAKGALALANLAAKLVINSAKTVLWAAQKIGLFRSVGKAAETGATEEAAADERGEARKLAAAVGSGIKWVAVKSAHVIAVVAQAAWGAATTVASWAASGAKLVAQAAADGARWVAAWVSVYGRAAAQAVANGAKTVAAWAASGVKMAAQAAADGARWLAAWTVKFAGAATAATVNGAKVAAAWAAQTAKLVASAVADGAKWLAALVVKFVAAAASAVIQAGITAAAWIAANIAMIVATGGILLAIAAVIAIGVFLISHWSDVKAIAGQVWSWIQNLFETVWNAIVSAVQNAVDFVKGIFAWFGTLPGQFGQWFSGIYHGIVDWIGQALSFIESIPGRILSALGDLGSLLLNAGKDLVTGLWNGIVSMGQWLWNQIMGWIKSVVPGPILSFLGISSPSKWMRDNVGAHLPTGLAEGIKQTSHIAEAQAATLARSVAAAAATGRMQPNVTAAFTATGATPGLAGMVTGATGGAALAAGATAGTTVLSQPVTVTVQGSILTESDLAQTIQQVLLRHNIRNSSNATTYGGFS